MPCWLIDHRRFVEIRNLLGLSAWDPYCGLSPETFARRQQWRRRFWLVVGLVVLGSVTVALLS